jgi:hypothetical protein
MTIDELEAALNRQQKEERRLVNKNSGYPKMVIGRTENKYVRKRTTRLD